MSLIEHFQYLLTRRTYQRSYSTCKNQQKLPSTALISLNKLSQSIYDEAWKQKISYSPNKTNTEKYHQLRKKMVTRASQRQRKLTIKSTIKDLLLIEEPQKTLEVTPGLFSCSKAIVHSDQKAHETQWKRSLRLTKNEQPLKKIQNDDNPTSIIKSTRKLSLQVNPSSYNNRLFVEKHIRIKMNKRMSATMNGFAFKSQSEKFQNQIGRLKYSPVKQPSSSPTKQTKCSQNEFDRIDPWNCIVLDAEQLEF